VSSELELTAMRHMKHLSHFAEELAEAGHDLEFVHPLIDSSASIETALQSDLELTEEARERFVELSADPEMETHRGLKVEVDHMISQEEFLSSTVAGLLSGTKEPPPDAGLEEVEGSDAAAPSGFTVGSLIEK
jgi:hypothetical protein